MSTSCHHMHVCTSAHIMNSCHTEAGELINKQLPVSVAQRDSLTSVQCQGWFHPGPQPRPAYIVPHTYHSDLYHLPLPSWVLSSSPPVFCCFHLNAEAFTLVPGSSRTFTDLVPRSPQASCGCAGTQKRLLFNQGPVGHPIGCSNSATLNKKSPL